MLKKATYILLIIILFLTGLYFWLNEPIPNGKQGVEAEQLTDNMFNAINFEAWQNTGIVSWEFPGGHNHVWDKERHLAKVEWKDYSVIFQIDSQKGIAYEKGKKLSETDAKDIINKAWQYWANDSFWLNAPAKARDGGTDRQLVELEDGKKGLLVLYHGGGVTPGDKYLWVLDENNLPLYCKMWVSIIPIGGIKFTWENWKNISTGAKIAQSHKGAIGIELKNIKAGKSVVELFPKGDPFQELTSFLE